MRMQNHNPKEFSIDRDEDQVDWDEELIRAVGLRVGRSEKDPEKVRLDRIKVCLVEGANLDVQDKYGDTILHTAVKRGYQRTVKFIQERNARTDILNHNGETAITMAESLRKEDIIRLLRRPVERENKPEVFRSSGPDGLMSLADNPKVIKRNSRRIDRQKGPNSKVENTYLATQTLHKSWPGIVYQLQHLAFTLHCALQQKDPYFLLATEMVEAEKLDDVVLLYKNCRGEQVGRFVQIKYTSNPNNENISAKELLDDGGKLSVLIYFISWRKVRENKLFHELKVRNMILCTNRGLDLDDLKKNKICYRIAEEPDKSFELKSELKTDNEKTVWYKLLADNKSNKKLYDKLGEMSDGIRLAKLLAKCVYKKINPRVEMEIFRDYHPALVEHVFSTDSDDKKFHAKFVQNQDLPLEVEKFREVFLSEFRKIASDPEIESSEKHAWEEIQNRFKKLDFRKDFGVRTKTATGSKLPVDYRVDDEEIERFLEEFTLAVNQPNEDELDGLIRLKIDANSRFNLLNTELLKNAFQTKMLNWFVKKAEQGKGEGKEYFSYEVGEKFFKDMNDEVRSLITIGVYSAYCERIKAYDVHFKTEMQVLKDFLTNDESDANSNRILELVAPAETLSTALRVYDTLERIPKYKKMDSFIFTGLDSLKLPSILKTVMTTFGSLRHPNLLIVDCGSNSAKQYLQTLWNPLCKIVANNVHKRMIAITRIGEEFAGRLEPRHLTYRGKEEDFSFRNLTNDSQRKVLEKPVTRFQGEITAMSFGELTGVHVSDNLGSEEFEDLSELMDPDTLVELIRCDEMKIGADIKRLEGIEELYINRSVIQRVVVKKDIFEDSEIPDLLAVSGTEIKISGKSVRRKDASPISAVAIIDKYHLDRSTQSEETLPIAQGCNNVTILASSQEEEQFDALCAENEDRNVHWLAKERGKYRWNKSQGDISYLMRFREASESHDRNMKYLSEDQLADHDEPVVISDTAGMGKSTMLTYLASKMKGNDPGMLVLRIDLNHRANALAEVKAKSSYDLESIDGAVRFLVNEILLSRETSLARKVFQRIIKSKHRVALIFDEFDEISPTHEDAVINLLKTLKNYGMKKLFVATRPHTSRILESRLKAFSYEIQRLSADNQVDFLTKFWKIRLGSSRDTEEKTAKRIKKYANEIMKKLADSIEDQGNKFTGIPLQARLVAEIFEDHSEGERQDFDSCKEFMDLDVEEPKFPEKMNLVRLYEYFVEMKFDIFFGKTGGNAANEGIKEFRKLGHDNFIKTHEILALKALFDKVKVNELLDAKHRTPEKTRHDIVEERTGIISQFIDDNPRFEHRSYAEYFAAKFFSDALKTREKNPSLIRIFVADILLGDNYATTRSFMNWLLSDEHFDVLEGDFWIHYLNEHRSRLHETVFHVAAAEGHSNIIRLFLNCFVTLPKNLKAPLIDAKDRWNRTAVQRALEYGHLDAIKLLAEHTDLEVDSLDMTGMTPLHRAALLGKLNLVKYLLDKGASINSQNIDRWSPLYAAVEGGRLEVVMHLIDQGADVNSKDSDDSTPLHVAIERDRLDIADYLLDNRADIDARNIDGWSPLYLAAARGKIGVVKYLLGKKADINSQDKDGLTPLHVAVSVGESDVVKYLLDKGADINSRTNIGWTPMHLAAENGDLELVRHLVEKRSDVNCQNINGWSPLHVAAERGELDVVEYLIDEGADIDCQDKDHSTPLYVAAEAGNLDVLEYLLRKKANLYSQNINGWTSLHVAAQRGKLDVLKHLLINNEANINSQTKNGWTPLHLAAEEGRLEVVKYLLDNRADVDSRDNDDSTPLYVAAERGNLDVLEYLLSKEANVNSQNMNGWSALHVAARRGRLDVVKCLIDKKADVDAQDISGFTPVYVAAEEGELGIVMCLFDHGADINLRTNNGQTPLYAAALEGELDVVKYLVINGADIYSRDQIGSTPLYAALHAGKFDVARYLMAFDKPATPVNTSFCFDFFKTLCFARRFE